MDRAGRHGGGDAGVTSLFDGTRVSKDSIRVEAYGTIDELDACLGLARVEVLDSIPPSPVRDLILAAIDCMQESTWLTGAGLARPGTEVDEVRRKNMENLESLVAAAESEAGPLRRFIVPGGSRAEAQLHLARTVCRRAERRVVAVDGDSFPADASAGGEGAGWERMVLNRMSTLLFVLARLSLKAAGIPERTRGK